jgi:hypothetical protein
MMDELDRLVALLRAHPDSKISQSAATAIRSLRGEIAQLRAAMEDVTHGRGMFGVDASADLDWALLHLEKALEQNKPAATPGASEGG